MTMPPSDDELEDLGLYDPSAPNAAEQKQLLTGAFDLGATLAEVTRAVQVRYNLGPLMLDLSLRPPGETKDLREFLKSEPEPDLVRRIWSAFGLTDSEDPTVRVTPDAAEALRLLVAMASLIGEGRALGVARVIGAAMARLAETVSDAFRVTQEVPNLTTGQTRADVAEGYASTVPILLPPFFDAVAAVFRRHLIDVSYQTWSIDSDVSAVTHDRTVCFADLVGSTEAFRHVSIRDMADKLRLFEELVWEVVGAGGGRVVKLIGDEAMFSVEDPVRACRVGLELIARSEQPVRVGMAWGTVLGLHGDYFGETVNLAARIVTLADESTLVVSQAVRDALGADIPCESMGTHDLKGFVEPVPVYRVG
jgi:class 3 adenylate cyclase